MLTKAYPDNKKFIVDFLEDNPAWGDFADAVNDVQNRLIYDPIWQLQKLRDPDAYHIGDRILTDDGEGTIVDVLDTVQSEVLPSVVVKYDIPLYQRTYLLDGIYTVAQRVTTTDGDGVILQVLATNFNASTTKALVQLDEGIDEATHRFNLRQNKRWLVLNSKMLGFDYFNTKLTTADYYRIARFVSMFWKESGTKNFIRFIGFVMNVDLAVEQLWTRDYVNFARARTSRVPVWRNGQWYPTSHVQVFYNAEVNPQLDTQMVTQLFYRIAPVWLVLERIASYPILFGTAPIGPVFASFTTVNEYGVMVE